MKNGIVYTLLALTILLLGSCDGSRRSQTYGNEEKEKTKRYFLKGKHDKLLLTDDVEKKFEGAKEYYNAEEYIKALPLLKQLQVMLAGTKNEEEVRYFIAYSHYGMGELTLASYLFKRLTFDFPKGEFAQDAQYMVAECLYLKSPKYYLDQGSSNEAISAFQLYLERFPKGEKQTKATSRLQELRSRLEEKAYKSAELYYHIEKYEAAITSYKNMLIEFPDTDKREEVLFDIIQSNFKYAEKSIETKQKQRYQSTLEAYKDFAQAYPESKWKAEADQLYGAAKTKVEYLETIFKN